MLITVRLFAMLRERAGSDTLDLDLPEGALVSDALAAMAELTDGAPVVMAVNRGYAHGDSPLAEGDELALIPPVSGGGGDRDSDPVRVQVSPHGLSADAQMTWVADPRAGAVVVFAGVTREVERLDYEAYEEMALERMRAISQSALLRHGLCRVAVAHRVGSVALSQPSVVVAVSAAHRAEAFAGAREIIDAIKEQVPIWKREVAGGTSRWVEGSRPTV
jgi:molybdopterin synthase catalytic subunit/molybdopterin converting factor small subunit